MVSLIPVLSEVEGDQPTARRENRACPREGGGEVCDPPLVGRLGSELAAEDVVGNDRPQTIVLGQATTSRTRPQAMHTHQPFDAMQTT